MLCAMVAFTYAIASVPASFDSADSVGSRGVGTSPLRFTNPLDVSGDRDLGDVVLGGSFTRFARAAGGLPPYKFSSNNISGLANSILASGAVDFSGKISGSVLSTAAGPIADVGGAIRFNVTVTDQRAGTNTLTEVFRLSVDSTGVFKFAVGGDLGTAPRFAEFATQIETINGKGNVSFASTAVSGITGVSKLSDIGLFLDASGKLFGKPYIAGTLNVTIEATDSTGAKAATRAGTGTSQVFSLVIEPTVDITSDFVATKVTVKTAGAGKDSVSVAGIANVKGSTSAAFGGKKLSAQVGNFKGAEVTLDAKGKGASAKGTKTNVAKLSINTKGQVKATYSKLTIGSLFTGITGTSTVLGTGVILSDSINTNDPLNYAVKGLAPKQTLTYSIGKNVAPAGAFLLTKVAGKDAKDGSGTAFKVDFLGIAGASAPNQAGSVSSVTKSAVSVGNTTDSTLVTTVKAPKVTGKGSAKGVNKVKSLSFDAVKGKGKAQTEVFTAGATGTGIPLAGTTTTSTVFPFSVTLSSATLDVFNGVGSAIITGTGRAAYTSTLK